MPPENPAGFAPADWLLVVLLLVLLSAGLFGRPDIQRGLHALAEKKRLCFVALFLLPIVLRLLLLKNHPVPVPDIYDEFSHLLQADTLLHGRLANPPHPMHRFFETFFVLQEPTYSSIYPLGMGLVLAFGQVVSGVPWTGVLILSGALCACCYWMLRGWVPPIWALLGGLVAVMEFGPLCQWTNSYWGGSLAATGGCLVFGALPRLRASVRWRDAVLLGAGFGMHMLARQVESVLLFLAVALFLTPMLFQGEERPKVWRISGVALAAVLPVIVLILLQNHAVTHSWTTLPEKLSQEQYGVPAALTFQQNPVPRLALTPQQEMDYKAQAAMHGTRGESWQAFFLRLEYRVRYYRFFFLPPLYLAAVAFLFTLRDKRTQWVAGTLAIFALGTNLFPYLLVHYLAGITCLFVLVSISGLRMLGRVAAGSEMVRVLVALCVAEFVGWYGLHLFETPSMYAVLRYETWDAVGHDNGRRRVSVADQLRGFSGPLLVFVRYSPRHVFQEEWVWNAADIDESRIVYARDLGPEEDQQLIRYYPSRKVLLLEPDNYVPRLSEYGGE